MEEPVVRRLGTRLPLVTIIRKDLEIHPERHGPTVARLPYL